jgi:hypothetical protein
MNLVHTRYGIWQTVWMEPVNDKFIENVRSIPNIDNENVKVEAVTSGAQVGDFYEVIVKTVKHGCESEGSPWARMWKCGSLAKTVESPNRRFCTIWK